MREGEMGKGEGSESKGGREGVGVREEGREWE